MFNSHLLRKSIGLAMISGSILALQVVYTRIFSIMIWHHFTYLVVGVALLGAGAAGTFLAVRQWDRVVLERRIGKLAILFSLSILLNLIVISLVHFDPLGGRQAILPTFFGLALYFAALFTTFFLGGLTIVSVFSAWVNDAHRLYFADLLGASLGTLLVVVMVQSLGGPGALALIAFLVLLAGFVFGVNLSSNWRQILRLGLVSQAGLVLSISYIAPLQLPVPNSKDLGWALSFIGVPRPEQTRWNPVARVDVLPPIEVEVPMIVGGVSSVYFDEEFREANGYQSHEWPLRLVTLDGTSMTGLYQFDGDLSRFEFLHHAVISAAYQVASDPQSTLHIGVGGGLDILLARLYGVSEITAIDINGDVIELLTGPYADYTGYLTDHPGTTIVVAEGRGFLMRDNAEYDIIQGIGLDNIAALSSGAYVLSESYLYTVEAFEIALKRLSPQGILSWTRNVNNPPRETLRLTAVLAEALRRIGAADPTRHIAIVSNEDNQQATLLVARQPFTLEAIERLRQWTALNRFHMLFDPFERLSTPYDAYLHAADPRAFEASYPYNIFPVTDDNPFFYNYFRWTDLGLNSQDQGPAIFRFPIGNLILLTMLSFCVLTAFAFIVLPLLRYKRDGLKTPHALPMLVYFSLLGLGYIFVEIVLIQRFTLFIGYPTHAIATTIFSMLFFSAIGSLVGKRIIKSPSQLRALIGLLVLAIGIYIIGLSPLFQSWLFLPDAVRIGLSMVIIAPLAFLMGMPFPTGLRALGVQAPALIPWAWGMNGVFSVLGSVLVILISMMSSFTVALVCALFIYGIAMLVAPLLWQTKMVGAPTIAGAAP